jgi:diadenosine tetraphosphate (Ap4A) HIT family hydrolase
MRLAGKALRDVMKVDRVNYALLGNAEPHLHWHLIPRSKELNPIPTKSPWNHPLERYPLDPGELREIRDELSQRLTSTRFSPLV